MNGVVIPLPGLAVHIWQGASGWFGVDTVRGKLDPDFPPEGAELFEEYAEANARAAALQDSTGLPILSHRRSF